MIAVSLLGCGGGSGPSGVEGSRRLSETTPEERTALCDYFDSLFMGETRVSTTCDPGGSASTGGSRDRCEALVADFDATCAAMVGDFERCFMAAEADPCVFYDPAICSASLVDCL